MRLQSDKPKFFIVSLRVKYCTNKPSNKLEKIHLYVSAQHYVHRLHGEQSIFFFFFREVEKMKLICYARARLDDKNKLKVLRG